MNVDDKLENQPVPTVCPANYGEDACSLAAHRGCRTWIEYLR